MENVIDFFFKVVNAAVSNFTQNELAIFFKESVLRHSKQRLNTSADKARMSAPRIRQKTKVQQLNTNVNSNVDGNGSSNVNGNVTSNVNSDVFINGDINGNSNVNSDVFSDGVSNGNSNVSIN